VPMEQRKGKGNIVLEAREKLTATGVSSVLGFDETQIEAETASGLLLVRGENLHIDSFDTDTGELMLSGRVDGLVYTERKPKQGFFARILK
jgi:sporulation protein YabP